MSTLQVTTITTVNNTTPLILQTGNTGGGQIVLESANADIQMLGDFKFINTTFSGNLSFSNSVGIGTTSPATRLHISDGNTNISSALYTSDFQTISGQNTAPGFNIIAAGTGGAIRGVFKATRARGSLSSPLVPIINDNTFSLLGAIYDGTTGRATAGINMDVDGTVSDNVAPQRISFWTGLTNTRTEKMRIDANGNVGIGTTTPSANLHVVGSANVSTNLRIGANLSFDNIDSVRLWEPAANTLTFHTTSTERMRISSAGDILVGSADAGNTLRYLDIQNANTGSSAGVITRLITSNTTGNGITTVDIVKYKNGLFTINNNDTAGIFTLGNAGAERLRIDNNGQVGIGTSSPVTRFQTQISSGNNVGFFANIFPCAFGAFNNIFSAWNDLQIGPGTFFMNSGAVGLGTSSPSYKLHVANGSIAITSSTGAGTFQITDDSDSSRGLLLKSNHLGSSNTYVGTNSSIRNLVFGIDQVERMRLDTGGNVGIGTTSPNIRNSSGKVLAIAGTSITQPATIIQMGNKDAPGQGYSADETFYVSGIGSATEISRITASSLNGIGLYFRVKVAGHSASTGSGLNIKEYFYDGGSVTQISSTTTASIPPITTSVPSSGVVVVSLASANPAAGNFNGVVRIEWMAPVDFSGVNWTIS